MKILLFGASGSGKTTLGKEIEKRTNFVHLDADDYYWKRTKYPFTEKIPLALRNKRITTDFKKNKNVVISGSMLTWGKEWKTAFDLVIFIRLENNERMKRLQKREIERYRDKLLEDEKTQQISKEYLNWANQYENPNFKGSSLTAHHEWIKSLNCKVLKIDGMVELNNTVEKVLTTIKNLSLPSPTT